MSTSLVRGDYSISTDRQKFGLVAIHAFLTTSYWSPGVPLEVVERAIDHSLGFGLFHRGKQVGFARVISDRTTFAYLNDVYVLEAHRGKGLAKWLMEVVMEHPDLQGLRRFMLATADAHGLYNQFGFQALSKPSRIMEIFRPDAHRTL